MTSIITPKSTPNIPYIRSLLRSVSLRGRPRSLAFSLHGILVKSGHLPLLLVPLFHMYSSFPSTPLEISLSFSLIPTHLLTFSEFSSLSSSLPPSPSFFRIFRSLLRLHILPDSPSLLHLLSLSAKLRNLPFGVSAHLLFLKLPILFGISARNSAVHFYFSVGRVRDAVALFNEGFVDNNVVSWTVLLTGLLNLEGIVNARKVFDEMPVRNLVSWTVMIRACILDGLSRDAFELLKQVCCSDIAINYISMCSLLSACSQVGDLAVGRWLHWYFMRVAGCGFGEESVKVSTALVDMYAKCGRVDVAKKVFDGMPRRNVVSWNAMLSGFSMHGEVNEVLRLFEAMVGEGGERPDDITFVSVLSACSRAGFVERGRALFDEFVGTYGMKPKIEHYACIVDLLGRAGRLEEAESLVREMPFRPSEVVLGSLLASCNLHKRLELGECLMNELVQLDPRNTEHHILLSNMYSSVGRHAEADRLRLDMKQKGMRKAPGISYIEISGDVHHFVAGDKSHPQTEEVYAMLKELLRQLHLAGYVPDADSQVSHVVDSFLENIHEREEREQALFVHSEKLALCLGLISTKPGVVLRIFKNLRICSDCHEAMKFASAIFNRVIIVRDRNRFHHFKKGSCSCSDYW